jgi:hypothetical protein
MEGFAIRTILFLVGLVFLLVILSIGIRQRSTGWILAASAGLILIIGSIWMGSWKTYQCRYTTPDQITVVGHVRDKTNSYLNDYLVILYRENEEMGRVLTYKGRFSGDKKDKENNGYFEFDIPNTDQFNRCSMAVDFSQYSSGHDFLWIENKTTYLWHNFDEIQADIYLPIEISGQKTKYTLEVLPSGKANLPPQIFQYPTYLNQNGKVTINALINAYTSEGTSAALNPTNFYAHTSQHPGLTMGGREVRNAWVEANITTPDYAGPDIADNDVIDIDNCKGLSPIKKQQTKTLAFMREVQFRTGATQNYDLGLVALKASPSLGFTQGEVIPNEATVNIDVPAGAHKVYKITWHVYWKPGIIRVDSGQLTDEMPFRSSYIKYSDVWTENVSCP